MDAHVALIQSVAHLIHVSAQVLDRDVVVDSHDGALQDRPHGFNGVGVDVAPNVRLLSTRMIDTLYKTGDTPGQKPDDEKRIVMLRENQSVTVPVGNDMFVTFELRRSTPQPAQADCD